MTPLLALTLTATLSTPAAVPEPPAPLLTQAVTLAMRAPEPPATPPGGDSLKNGAIAGAITGGLLMAGASFICYLVDETEGSGDCIAATALWGGIGAGVGAALGAGVDALFERSPRARAAAIPKGPSARVRFRF